jgi:hypothetical protein
VKPRQIDTARAAVGALYRNPLDSAALTTLDEVLGAAQNEPLDGGAADGTIGRALWTQLSVMQSAFATVQRAHAKIAAIQAPHTWHACTKDYCTTCDGGLQWCTVCNAAEAELLPSCPGYLLTSEALQHCCDRTYRTVADLDRARDEDRQVAAP